MRRVSLLALALLLSASVLARSRKDDDDDDDDDDTPLPPVPGYSKKPVLAPPLARTPVAVPSPGHKLTQEAAEALALDEIRSKPDRDQPDVRELLVFETTLGSEFNRPVWKVHLVGRVPHGCAEFELSVDAETSKVLHRRGNWYATDRDYEDDCVAIYRGDPDPRDAVMAAADAELAARGYTDLHVDRLTRPNGVWTVAYKARKDRKKVKVTVLVERSTNVILEVQEPASQR